MNAFSIRHLALGAVISIAAMAISPASAATTFADWTVTKTFKAGGDITCSLRAGAVKNGYTLAVEGKAPKGSRTIAPNFTFGNLPPILAGKKGVIRDVTLTVGNWSVSGLKADWSRGSSDTNSRVAVPLTAKEWSSVITALSSATSASASFTLAGTSQTIPISMSSGAAAATAFADCIR